MTSFATTAEAFFQRATQEARRYGEDPWVFLREMVQNSRDAGASEIHISSSTLEGCESISCLDNGVGMNREHVEHFLLRLYASSKEHDEQSVGYYGVGFWSVLLFEPRIVRIASRNGDDAIAFEINIQSGELHPISWSMEQNGTQIQLIRDQHTDETASLDEVVLEKLNVYVCHVLATNTHARLALFHNGKRIDKPFALPQLLGHRFKTKDFDGVLGYGKAPFIRLYKGGILVRNLTSLEEVIPSRNTRSELNFSGLHPQVSINIEKMQVLMDREHVFEDPLLHGAVDYLEAELLRRHYDLISLLYPLNFRNKLRYLGTVMRGRKLLTTIALLVMVALAGSKVTGILSGGLGSGMGQTVGGRATGGSTIDPISTLDRATAWDFEYSAQAAMLFRLRTFPYFHDMRGFYPVENQLLRPAPRLDMMQESFDVTLTLTERREMVLPCSLDFGVAPETVRLDGELIPVWLNQFGEPVIQPETSGRVEYRLVRTDWQAPPAEVTAGYHRWPDAYDALFDEVASLPKAQAADRLVQFLSDRLIYDRSRQRARSFYLDRQPWVAKATKIEAGDCDVVNGLLVLMLRNIGIPAQLSVGLPGRQGRAGAELHAWARYYVEGWQVVDLTSMIPKAEAEISLVESPQAETDNLRSLPVFDLSRNRTDWWMLGVWSIWGLFTIFVLARLVYRWITRRRLLGTFEAQEHDDQLSNILERFLFDGDGSDPMKLRYRPAFPDLKGQVYSLVELEQVMSQRPVFIAGPNLPLLSKIRPGSVILNGESPTVQMIGHLYTGILHLDKLEALSEPVELPPKLAEAERIIRQLDEGFRIHLAERQKSQHLCIYLPFADENLGENHLLLDRQEQMALLETIDNPRDIAVELLEIIPLYGRRKENFLAGLAA